MVRVRHVTFSGHNLSKLMFLKSRPKKAWIRVFEAVIGIILVTSVVLVLYSRQVSTGSDYILDVERRVLDSISLSDFLRNSVIAGDNQTIIDYVNSTLPVNLNFEVRVCELEMDNFCKMTRYIDGEVFVREAIISSNLQSYNPKLVRLFVWEGWRVRGDFEMPEESYLS